MWEDIHRTVGCIHPEPGDLLVFEGRALMHCVPRHGVQDHTIMVLFNLYEPGDDWRPTGMDSFSLSTGRVEGADR